ncbi:MAG TPA: hypothetical protein VNL13_07155 [Sulfolobales archaeon]|nr:hypothetical protein [Sulfolobales archaeon]
MSREREEVEEDIEELEEGAEEATTEEAEAEIEASDLLLGLDQINTMIHVTEIWDSVVSGRIGVEDAKKLLNRISIPVKGVEEEEEEVEEEAKKTKAQKKSSKKKSKG